MKVAYKKMNKKRIKETINAENVRNFLREL